MNHSFLTGAGLIMLTILLHTLYKLKKIKNPPENSIGPTMSGWWRVSGIGYQKKIEEKENNVFI